jgi:DNA-binding beta-propeller fold protein YncE
MKSSMMHFRRRVAGFIRGPAVGLFLLAQLLGSDRAGAVLTVTINALQNWISVEPTPNRFYYNAVGVAVPRGDKVYVLWVWPSANSHVEQTNLEGVWQKSWGGPQFSQPSGIAVDSFKGNVYVCDPGAYDRIVEFDRQGNFIQYFGGPGTANGQFKNPTCIAVGQNRCVYVADATNHDVQKFSADGVFQRRWKLERAPGLYLVPNAIAVGQGGEVYVLGGKVPEATSKNVLVFTADGTYVRGWNSNTPDRGANYLPAAIAVNGIGMVVISDIFNKNLQEFNSTGVYERAIMVMAKGSAFRFDSLCFYYDDYLYGSTALAVCKFRLF